MTEVQEEIF